MLRWILANVRDLARIAKAAETIAHELAAIRRMMQDDQTKEDE